MWVLEQVRLQLLTIALVLPTFILPALEVLPSELKPMASCWMLLSQLGRCRVVFGFQLQHLYWLEFHLIRLWYQLSLHLSKLWSDHQCPSQSIIR